MQNVVEDIQHSFMIKFSLYYIWEFAQVEKWCLQKYIGNNKILFSSNIKINEKYLHSPLYSLYSWNV